MNNQEIFILVLVIVLVIVHFSSRFFESFETNLDSKKILCQDNPFNSNCSCPSDAPVQTVLGDFPMNYGEESPYMYTCVPRTSQESDLDVLSIPPLIE
jgi:hypothetical protein